jgi:hypothetical protein
MIVKARLLTGEKIKVDIARLDAMVRRAIPPLEQFFKRTGFDTYQEMEPLEIAKVWHFVQTNGINPKDLTLLQLDEVSK